MNKTNLKTENLQQENYKKVMANLLANMNEEEKKKFYEELAKQQNAPTEKTAKEKLNEKLEMMRFKRLNKFSQKKIKDQYDNIMGTNKEKSHSCGDDCNHDHNHNHNE